jgi:two-component system response regulator
MHRSAPAPADGQPTPVILVVEDSADDEALMVRALRRASIAMQIVVVRDGAEALHYLLPECEAHRGPRPRVVLSDLKLPKLNGLELLRRLRADARTATLPVVLFSSSAQDADLQQAYAIGANSYIRKPVDSQLFADIVRQIGEYWLELNEATPLVTRHYALDQRCSS